MKQRSPSPNKVDVHIWLLNKAKATSTKAQT